MCMGKTSQQKTSQRKTRRDGSGWNGARVWVWVWVALTCRKKNQMPKRSRVDTDAALHVVLNVRETEQMQALKADYEKLKKKLETGVKVTAIVVKSFLDQAQNHRELLTAMEAEELMSAPVADALRRRMTFRFPL